MMKKNESKHLDRAYCKQFYQIHEIIRLDELFLRVGIVMR